MGPTLHQVTVYALLELFLAFCDVGKGLPEAKQSDLYCCFRVSVQYRFPVISRAISESGQPRQTGFIFIATVMIFAGLLAAESAFAQVATSSTRYKFEPLQLHEGKSTELISAIDKHFAADTRSNKTNSIWVEQVRQRQAMLLKRMVRARTFINNDTLQQYVDSYFDRIVKSNGLPEKKRLVLIMNSAESNAACYGSGVFIVTAGLLANMPDESSLAFILAHEVAHDESSHVQQSLLALSRDREARNPRAAFAKILLTDVNTEYIDAFRTTMYASASMSREHELEADSMALAFIYRAGYPPSAGIRALHSLETMRQAETSRLFASVEFNDFPFKQHWLTERLKVYHRKPANTFLWSYDSLRSHPEILNRIKILSGYELPARASEHGLAYGDYPRDSTLRERVVLLSAFQSVEAAYQNNQYDIAFFNLLRLLNEHPGNNYLVSRTAGILVDMYHAKNEGHLETLSQFTTNLSDSERLVNNFLFNLSKEEVAELAYHFLNNKGNFDRNDPGHYYLLWQACYLTSRETVKSKVASAYRQRFGGDVQSFKWD